MKSRSSKQDILLSRQGLSVRGSNRPESIPKEVPDLLLKRRELLRLLSYGGGALVLAACGSEAGPSSGLSQGPGAPASGGALPNGFVFSPLLLPKASGTSPKAATRFDKLPGPVLLNDQGELYYFSIDAQGNKAVNQAKLAFAGSGVQVLDHQRLLGDDDLVADGRQIRSVQLASTNHRGAIACRAVLREPDPTHPIGASAVFLRKPGWSSPFELLATAATATPAGAGTFVGTFGDIQLLGNDDVLLVGHYAPRQGKLPYEGLFRVKPDGGGELLARTRESLGGSGEIIGKFGLIDGTIEANQFIQQVFVHGGALSPTAPSSTKMIPAVISGSLNSPERNLLRTSNSLAALGSTPVGDVYYGPRVSASGRVGLVYHKNPEQQVLHFAGRDFAASGDFTPGGKRIKGFSAPALGRNGLAYVLIHSEDDGYELGVTNGSEIRVYPLSGLAFQGDAIVKIGFGISRDQADSAGRLAFVAQGNSGTHYLGLGIPV